MLLLPSTKQVELTEKNFVLFAARNYINPRVLDPEEFEEDLTRFKYLKRLFSRYKDKQELQERLILNHLTVIHNVFGIQVGVGITLAIRRAGQPPRLRYHRFPDKADHN